MATRKTTKTPRALTKAEKEKLFNYIGKARVFALKVSKDAKYRSDVRRTMKSIEKKLWGIGNDYRWGSLTDYK